MDNIYQVAHHCLDKAYQQGRADERKYFEDINMGLSREDKRRVKKDTLEELWERAIYMHDDYVEYVELRNIIDEMLKEQK